MINNNLNKALCLSLAGYDPIKGSFADNENNYINIFINLNPNKLDKLDKLKRLFEQNTFFLMMYFTDTKIDHDDSVNYMSHSLNYYETLLDFKISKLAKINLSLVKFSTDNNLFFPYQQVREAIIYDFG